MTKIAVIDYGMGNLHSVAKALEHAASKKVEIKVSADPQIIQNADKVLLPGVGAIRDCIGEMQRLDLVGLIKEAAREKPFLGICIGMQALMSRSDENDGVDCLDIIPGNVIRFADDLTEKSLDNSGDIRLKIPHMGWNQVQQKISHPLWKGIEQQQRFYFVHSYYVKPDNESVSAASTIYGHPVTVALAKKNIFATQFHPEKSASAGLQLFANFIAWDGTI